MLRQTDGRGAGARRAEVLATLSIAIDLGLPMEHMLRSSLLAAILAEELELPEEQRVTIYYTNLVLWIGCHADSHEFSRWFGDDLAMRRDSYQLDWSGRRYMRCLLKRTGSGQPLPRRTQRRISLLLAPPDTDGNPDPLTLPLSRPDGRAHRARTGCRRGHRVRV